VPPAAATAKRVDKPPPHKEPPKIEKPAYLQIESVLSNAPGDQQRVEYDARQIQEYLRQQGVATVLRWVNDRANIIVYSSEGYPEGEAAAADRRAFQKRIEDLGRQYSKMGGNYSFIGC